MDLDHECPECGACAFEIPDSNGDTWCAMCGEKAGESPECEESLADADEKSNHRRAPFCPQVEGRSERPLAQQASTRIAGASSSTRRAYDDSEGGW